MFGNYRGKIIQVMEGVSFGDAVSSQVIALDKCFKSMGLKSEICCEYLDDKVTYENITKEFKPQDYDVVIYHSYGYSRVSLNQVINSKTTKILHYHNITPETFFEENTSLYNFCKKGREQLKETLSFFNYFWADSEYNSEELIEYGIEPCKIKIIPIVVDFEPNKKNVARENGSWLFVGRLVESKKQIELVDIFSKVRKINEIYAQHLYIVGATDSDSNYTDAIVNHIKENGLEKFVSVTGKVSNENLMHYYQIADIYVSVSAHEGFGVPLIEASLCGIPVLSLNYGAIKSTLNGFGVLESYSELIDYIINIQSSCKAKDELRSLQFENCKRFKRENISSAIKDFFMVLLPEKNKYKTVSVVVCTYNRINYLKRVLDYLRFQINKSFEIIIVNGPSTDGTNEYIDSLSNVNIRAYKNHKKNLSISRNIGLSESNGDIIAFIDDDAIPFDDWIENILIEYNSRPLTTAAIGGPVYYAGTFWFQAQDNGINKFCDVNTSIDYNQINQKDWFRYNTGTNATFTRDSLIYINGFDEFYDYYLDEADVCVRLQMCNFMVAYSPDIIVRHEFAQSENRIAKYNYNWHSICKNTVYFICKYSENVTHELINNIYQKITHDRIMPLQKAFVEKEIDYKEYATYLLTIYTGIKEGFLFYFNVDKKITKLKYNYFPKTVNYYTQELNSTRPPLHVCIITKEFPPFSGRGGVGTLYNNLASELLLMGHSVTVITLGDHDHVFKQGRFSIYFKKKKIIEIENLTNDFSDNISWSLVVYDTVSVINESKSIDIIDTSIWDFECLALSLKPNTFRPLLVVRLVTPFKVTATINNWNVDETALDFFNGAEYSLINNADGVVSISDSILEKILSVHKGVRLSNYSKIYCGIAYWPFFDVNSSYGCIKDDALLNFINDKKYLLFIGRLERRKGVDLVFDLLPKLAAKVDDFLFIFLGRDVEEWQKYVDLMFEPNLKSRVYFLGEADEQIKEKVIANAYAVLFPSRYESFGLVPLECFVHGTPVIASNMGAITEVVKDGISGLIFDINDPEDFYKKTELLICNSGLRSKLSKGAYNQIMEFTSRKMAVKSVDYYLNLIIDKDKESL